MKRLFSIVLSLLLASSITAQTRTDSLETRLEGTVELERLAVLADLVETTYSNAPSKAMAYAREAVSLLELFPEAPITRRVLYFKGRTHGRFGQSDSLLIHAIRLQEWAVAHSDRLGEADGAFLEGIGHFELGSPDKSRTSTQEALEGYEGLGNKAGVAKSFHFMSVIAQSLSDYDEALTNYARALEIQEEIGNKQGIANSLVNMAGVHQLKGEFATAIDLYIRSLDVMEELDDQIGVAMALTGVGSNHYSQKAYGRALSFYGRALEIQELVGDKRGIANSLSNIGNIYNAQGEYGSALTYYDRTLTLREELDDQRRIASTLRTIGSIYQIQGAPDDAIEYFSRAIQIQEDLGDKRGIVLTSERISRVYRAQDRSEEALAYADRAVVLADSMGVLPLIRSAQAERTLVLEKLGRFEEALTAHRAHKAAHDSLFSAESQSVIAELQTQFQTGEQQEQIDELEQNQLIQQRNTMLLFSGLGFMLLTIIAGIVYMRTLKSKNRIIEEGSVKLSKLSRVVEQSPASVVITDLRGSIEYVNPKFEELTGYSMAEAIGKNSSMLKSGHTPPEVYADLWATISSGEMWRGEFKNIKKNGETYWEFASIAPVLNEAGDVINYVAVKEDITERKEATRLLQVANEKAVSANEALTELEAKARLLKQVAEASNAALTAAEALQEALVAVCSFTKWPVGHVYLPTDDDSEILRPSKIWHLEDKSEFEDFQRITMATTFAPGIGLPGRVYSSQRAERIADIAKDENFPRAKKGSDLKLHGAFAFPVVVDDSVEAVLEFYSESEVHERNEALFQFISDVSLQLGFLLERLKNRQLLEDARAAADVANQAKSSFLANMSHEIRTPMNAILGFTELLDEQIQDTQQRKYLTYVQSSGKSLLTLINDILDLSKVEAGKLTIQYDAFDARQTFSEMQYVFSHKIEQKGLEFVIDVETEMPPALILDEVRLRQVLINIIGNAVKFTEEGQIKLVVRSSNVDGDASSLDLFIDVEDTGIGIPEDQISKIFGAFEQTAGQKVSKYGGTGLGLAITKKLIELMNGEVTIESELGKGSTFHVVLRGVAVAAIDMGAATSLDDLDPTSIKFEPALIQIADDIAVNRALVKGYLQGYDFEIEEAEHGKELLNLARVRKPDLVITDMKMPVMDGYETTRAIKADERLRDVPVVALTASVMEQSAKEISALCDGYLHKPVKKSVLIQELMRHLPHEVSADAPASTSDSTSDLNDLGHHGSPEQLRSLLAVLEEFRGEWEDLSEHLTITDIEAFGGRVKALGEQYGGASWRNWGATLESQAQMFEVDVMQQTLEAYPELIEELRSGIQA